MPAEHGIARPEAVWLLPACLIMGVFAAHGFRSLPPPWLTAAVTVLSAAALCSNRLRWPAVFVLAACWALFSFTLRALDRLDPALAGQLVQVTATISSIPSEAGDYVRFRVRPDAVHRSAGLPTTLQVRWYRDWPELSPGQRWQFELRVKPPWGRVNFQGPDKERWLFAQGIGGLATVHSGHLLTADNEEKFPAESLRGLVLQRIAGALSDTRQRGVVQALATGDRSGLSSADNDLLRTTGTSHLLAISGLHIGLAAAGGFWLGRLLLMTLPPGFVGAGRFVPLATGLLAALVYTALAGFGVPTLRAMLMLAVITAGLLTCRAMHPFRSWTISLAAILLIDPSAPLRAGFWFSFLAVAALFWMFQPRPGKPAWWLRLLAAQLAVVLALMPLGAFWFQSFTPSGLVANLAAIPWVSFLVVPLVLCGLLVLPFSLALASLAWELAGAAVSLLLRLLGWIDRLQGQLSLLAPPSALQAFLAVTGAFVLLLPRGVPARWMGIFLVLPLFFPPHERSPAGTLEVEVLDAGQGTAVLVTAGGRSLLYDSGPGDGAGRDLVDSVIAPALARHGRQAPQQVVISHGDLDHAGGLHSLQALYPDARFRANLPDSGRLAESCRSAGRWEWPGVSLRVLHPTAGLPYLGNDSSCVLSLRAEQGSLLLPGDISARVENRLALDRIGRHRVVLVPHHGSLTSSSEGFINNLEPEIAIATASLGNRFGFPRPEIRQRYERGGARFWSTGECGALRLRLGPGDRIEAVSARRQRKRIWRWPAGPNCP